MFFKSYKLLNLFDNIKKITRQSSYKVDTHDGKHNNQNSNRLEEIMAIEIFRQGSLNILGKILDYQTPLKNEQKNKAGKIDIVSYNKDIKTVYLLELKKRKIVKKMKKKIKKKLCFVAFWKFLHILKL